MNLIILGPQGSGKGTQAKLLAEKFGYVHVSSGSRLREFAKNGTPKGDLIADLLTTGELMPFDTVMEVIEPDLLGAKHGFILDGTPRNLMQAEYLEWFLKERGLSIDKVILLNIPREVSLDRLQKRAKIENRSDDTPEAIHARLDIYDNETIPVIEYFRKQDKLIEVDGTPDIQTIFLDIVSKLENK
ncbi:MAG: Adenylate kinase [Candidatus Collierbacteria bacterium GW2011_GWC2_44_18]|uniref:Adenylate kinase n=1 Tax=Candidatus Collierbacteria bacterium GW2011_GWC2_44_18 TaxID=1618392 RepID=A0A0G1HS86_9BACT|nr:MAG: Adenylate kinase [Microgenomates group bacterium GW2011_GWC1_44_10]KKT49800.1 MAG: Adenylate kinase [Candidatus Collierbacteria bacterium GW2011_GWC2_44_18]